MKPNQLVTAPWQTESKLIGYGTYSLVFRPAFLIPNPKIHPLPETFLKEPSTFVGLICTQEHFETRIKKATEILKKFLFPNPPILFPVEFSGAKDSLPLQNEQIQMLMKNHFAVQKRIEYDQSWADQPLIQTIYPYGGISLAELEKKRDRAPSWTEFFKGMVEIVSFLTQLHNEGYIHGDLSPNNVLYNKGHFPEFKIIDWTMLSKAAEFLEQTKGSTRVPCWPPEHFALTTTRLKDVGNEHQWLIYAEELQKYITRSLEFSFNEDSNRARQLRSCFEPFLIDATHTVFQTFHTHLKIIARDNPVLIGKYHEVRYFMDTIARCMASIFPNKNEKQQKAYNSFLSLYLVQNLEDRKIYLEDTDRLLRRLTIVLQNCANVENKNAASAENTSPPVEGEEALLTLLNKSYSFG